MRLIDADKIKLPQGFFEKVDNVPKFYKWLDKQLTVDAEPVRHGRWICSQDDAEDTCSCCQYHIYGKPYNGKYLITPYNYCPNCGAKMDESTMGQVKPSDRERKEDAEH